MYDVKIRDIREENINVKTFSVTEYDMGGDAPMPGQFAMLGIPGPGERPFSYGGMGEFTIQRKGPVTEAIFDLEVGDYITCKGPLGNGFPEGEYTLIGGGVGIVPLRYLADHMNSNGKPPVEMFFGGATSSDLLFLDEFKQMGVLHTATMDGSHGTKGLITDIPELKEARHPFAICGPEKMMEAVAELLDCPKNTFLSLERYMACGEGICGKCTVDTVKGGLAVCTDGPIFKYSDLLEGDFGKWRRDAAGIKHKI